MIRKTATAVCGAAVLAVGMTGCVSTFEGSGSKDAASAEQLALRLDDPWAQEAPADAQAKAEGTLADGVYTGEGKGMEGPITVTLLVQDNRISCLETTQEGESQNPPKDDEEEDLGDTTRIDFGELQFGRDYEIK